MKKKKILSVPPNYFYLCIIITVVLHFIVPQNKTIMYPINLIGIIFIFAGIYLVIKSWSIFIENKTSEKFITPAFLISTGLYSISRNPMYLGGVLFLIGLSILTGKIITLISPLLFFLIMHYMFIPHEEEILENTFGWQFLNYKNKVRKWL